MVMVNENWQIVSIYCLIGLVISNYFVFNRNLIVLYHLAKTGKEKKKKKNSELGIIVYLKVFCCVAYLIQVVKWGI